jgi:cell division protein FtsQ
MKRLRLAGAVLVIGAAAGAPFWGPPALRRLPFFAVRHVEVAGARLLAPQEVLAASGIRTGGSVWDESAPWEAALRRNPLVASARVERRLPDGLRIVVSEKRPAGLVDAGTLVPATAQGEILPVDPSRVPVDLPIVRASARSAAGRALLASAGRLGDLDPALMARVSEVRPGSAPGELLLATSAPSALVRVPADADEGALRRLDAALDDVRRRGAGGPGQEPVRMDLRFEDQVVVRFPAAAPVNPAATQAPR